jgi:hypothetical protein
MWNDDSYSAEAFVSPREVYRKNDNDLTTYEDIRTAFECAIEKADNTKDVTEADLYSETY